MSDSTRQNGAGVLACQLPFLPEIVFPVFPGKTQDGKP